MLSEEAKRALEARYYPNLQEEVFGRFEAQFLACLADESCFPITVGRNKTRPKGGAMVLDAGSGPGSWILQLSRERIGLLMGADIYVPDVSRLDAFVLARCEQLPFAERTFDMVVAYMVFEHLPEPRLAFREYARVLKPGGYLVFKTPAVHTPLFLLAKLMPTRLHKRLKARIGTAEGDVFPTYYRANKLSSLERELSAAGFQRDWVYTVDQTYAYLSHARWTYALGLLYSRLTRWPILGWLRNQIIGIYRLSGGAQ